MLLFTTKIDGRAKPWRVTYRADLKRKTRHFKTEAEAKAFARSLRVEDVMGDLAVSPDERVLIARLRAAASQSGVPVAELVESAVRNAAESAPPVTQSVRDSIKEFMTDCRARNLRPATLDHYNWKLMDFARGRELDPVASISRESVVFWITTHFSTKDSRKGARAPIMAWLRWCCRQGYADPARWRDALTWSETLSDETSIGILRPGAARIILDKLPPRLRLAFALCCLTGIRPKGELSRLRWSHVDGRRQVIDLPGEITKTRRGRTLHDLPPVVWEWIAYGRRHRRGEMVLPIQYREFRKLITEASPVPWPNDATRHSFASYGYHVLGVERTVELMGHVGGYGLFASRYKACARGWTARLWFGMGPG